MRTLSLVALALSTAVGVSARAQAPAYPVLQPQTTADQLAAVMRRLATAPTDTYALIQAGELSAKLDDMSAAAAFFARADKIDPRNGRVKAGMASILVRAERPGEALRYYQMAQSYGLDPGRYAADRGLAYDLVGEQERAQRDYRLALRTAPADDETVRRYALSLGISGRQATALEQLDPLIRRRDRAAWRVRAFVLAMIGDLNGANKIATAVMPAGMASGLRPFFERLPGLSASDRAFAVHFGEVRPTAERLADARMKPIFPALGPDPFAPVRVAAVQPRPAPVAKRGLDRNRRERLAGRNATGPTAAPGTLASADASRSAIAAQMPVASQPVVRPAAQPVQVATARPTLPPTWGPPVPVASLPTTPTSAAPPTAAPVASLVASPASTAAANPPVQFAASPAPLTRVASAAPTPSSQVQPFSSPVQVAAIAPNVVQAASSAGTSLPVPSASQAVALPVVGPSAPITGVAASFTPPPAVASLAPAAPVTAVRSEDSILARIVASITVPGEELGIAEPARKPVALASVDPATKRTLAVGQVNLARETSDRSAAARTIADAAKSKPVESARAGARRSRVAASENAADAEPTARSRRGKVELTTADATPTTRGRRGRAEATSSGKSRGKVATKTDEAEETPVISKRAAGKRQADRKSSAAKNGTADKSAKTTTASGKEPGESGRIWVQVAGGAKEKDLPKAWSAAQKKAAVLKGREAYSTPLRATNRVVTGPFKTEAEARAFVNQLAKEGVSAFQFKSGTGQKMTKLSGR